MVYCMGGGASEADTSAGAYELLRLAVVLCCPSAAAKPEAPDP
jgi:hypothetical protein